MNTGICQEGEAHWALISQLLEPCTPALQLGLIESLGSFQKIYESQEPVKNSALNQRLQLIRRDYHRGQWQAEYMRIGRVLKQYQAHTVPITSPVYPAQLQQIACPPALLYVRGNPHALQLPQLAVVGSRRMSRAGDIIATSWSKILAGRGFAITSGMAIGIDSCAHQGAMEAPEGISIAVIATGIDCVYPRRNAPLAKKIVEKGGALVTEFIPGTPARPAHFPQRNRIISGLSLGVLVVEAAIKSGSLITAKYALEQNREVFAIPGPINRPQSKGCHQLIKQGACLVEKTDDLVAEIAGPLARCGQQLRCLIGSPAEDAPTIMLNDKETQLLEILGYDPVLIDEIHTLWPMDKLLQLLISLELKGLIASEQGYFSRI